MKNIFKKIIKSINLLNILLLSVIIISAIYFLLPLLDINVRFTLPAAKKHMEDNEEKTTQTQAPSIAEYTMIADENLFHPERKIPVVKAEEKPLPKPDFVLYGTLITDDISLAYLEDLKAPVSTPGRGKRQTALRKGDSMSGFTLKEIEAEKIVMVRGDERMMLYLNDQSRPKVRGEAEKPAPQQAQAKPVAPSLPKGQSVSVKSESTGQAPPVYVDVKKQQSRSSSEGSNLSKHLRRPGK